MPDMRTTSTWATPIDRHDDDYFAVLARSSRQTWTITLHLARRRERRETSRRNAEYRHRMYGEPLPQTDTRA